jgi:dihydrofolate synthase/folylpolyglutamate synthase
MVVLDCAHNESAARALSEALDGFTYSRLILVLGIMADKDIVAILERLARRADHIIVTAPDVERAGSPERLLEILDTIISRGGLSLTSSVAKSVDKAIRLALDKACENDLICISGSVFTVGEAKSFFEQL